jgi:predicted amidohydrolase
LPVSSVFIGAGGEIIAGYRKIHLFGYQSDETKKFIDTRFSISVTMSLAHPVVAKNSSDVAAQDRH